MLSRHGDFVWHARSFLGEDAGKLMHIAGEDGIISERQMKKGKLCKKHPPFNYQNKYNVKEYRQSFSTGLLCHKVRPSAFRGPHR